MSPRNIHPVAPDLLLAELGAVLFGVIAASAEERITLDVIGAVRMVGPEAVRPAAAIGRTQNTQTREASAGPATDGMTARHN